MLDHTGTRSGRNEHRGGGNVQKACLIPARSAELHQGPASGTPEHGTHRTLQQYPGKAREFGGGLPAFVQGGQEPRLGLLLNVASQEKIHRGRDLPLRQGKLGDRIWKKRLHAGKILRIFNGARAPSPPKEGWLPSGGAS